MCFQPVLYVFPKPLVADEFEDSECVERVKYRMF
jgi:hypothetical protein